MPVASFVASICTPTRMSLTAKVYRDLAPYHVRVQGVNVDVEKDQGGKPLYWVVKVGFTPQAAIWGEYVMLRQGWQRLGEYFEPRNALWASQFCYVPDGKGLYESDCLLKPKPGSAAEQGQKTARDADGGAFQPRRNPPKPWDERARERQPKPGKPKRKRGGWFGMW